MRLVVAAPDASGESPCQSDGIQHDSLGIVMATTSPGCPCGGRADNLLTYIHQAKECRPCKTLESDANDFSCAHEDGTGLHVC
jgi:hypothetical protein